MIRQAKVYVRTDGNPSLETVQRYLPSNYAARPAVINGDQHILIEGADMMGWTLDDYVIPRLISGLIFVEELTTEDRLERGPCICQGRAGHVNLLCPWFGTNTSEAPHCRAHLEFRSDCERCVSAREFG